MEYVIVSVCPQCGSPIYGVSDFHKFFDGEVRLDSDDAQETYPAPPDFTCNCRSMIPTGPIPMSEFDNSG